MNETLNGFDISKVNLFVNNEIITNMLFALIILLIGFTVGKLVGIALFKFLNGVEFDKGFKKISNSKIHITKTISSLVSWAIYTGSVVWALLTLRILNVVLIITVYFVALLIVGTIILETINSVPNLAYKRVVKSKKIKKGDHIKINNVEGEVLKVGFLNIKIKGTKGEEIYVPNKLIRKGFKKI